MSWESIFNAGLEDDDAAAWGRMVTELRALQDAIAAAHFDRDAVDGLAADLRTWRERLESLAGPELEQTNGRVPQLPVRGHAMLPEIRVRPTGTAGVEGVDGTVLFGRWHMGGGMAVHGGVVSLVFDEVLGILAAANAQAITRTAFLNTDFRALTPIGVELRVRAWIERVEGRKIVVRGEIRHGEVLCAEAEALFLQLRPEQGLGTRTT